MNFSLKSHLLGYELLLESVLKLTRYSSTSFGRTPWILQENVPEIQRLLPPAYGVWREGNVFSLSVHRGAPPPNWGGGRPGGTPPNWGGHPGGTPPTGGGTPGGIPPPGYPPTPKTKNGQSFGQKMDKILDKKWTKFWTKNSTNILETFGGGGGGRGRYASCGHAGGLSCIR